MDREKKARKRLAEKKWDGLVAMIDAYASEAVEVARQDKHETLAYDLESLDRLERILNGICPAPEPLAEADGEWITLLWGSFFGELLRHLHGGEWTMTMYPGSEFAVPTLEIDGSRLYPLMKVHRRVSMGAAEGLPAFYSMLSGRLKAGSSARTERFPGTGPDAAGQL